MKKILALALAFGFVGMASAVTFNWNSATAIKFNGSNLKSDDKVTGYLIYLASGSLSDTYTMAESFSASDIGVQVDKKEKTSAMSKISQDWSIDTSKYDNGSKFAMLLVYTGAADGKTYYNLSSTVGEISGMSVDPPVNAADQSFSFSYSTSSEKGKLSGGGGWTAVPEPSTAMLALAGLALLIKRRKA